MTTKKKVLYAIPVILFIVALVVAAMPGIVYATYDNVTLGTSKQFLVKDYGYAVDHYTGPVIGFWGAGYSLKDSRMDVAATLVTTYADDSGTARLGKYFQVSGIGSKVANIEYYGYYCGRLYTSGWGGSSSIEIDVVLVDQTTGSTWRTPVLSDSLSSLAANHGYQAFYTVDQTVLLRAGHQYLAYVEVAAKASCRGNGIAGSTFGNQAGSTSNYVRLYWISVKF